MTAYILTPKFRAGWLAVLEPRETQDNKKFEFKVEMIFDKDADLSGLIKIYQEAHQEKHGEAAPAGKSFQYKVPGIRKGIADAYESGTVPSGREGKLICYAQQSLEKGEDRKPIFKRPGPDVAIRRDNVVEDVTASTRSEIYSGAYYVANINAYGWAFAGKKGVSFGLAGIMKIGDGAPLVSQVDSKGAFSQYVSAEAPEASDDFDTDFLKM